MSATLLAPSATSFGVKIDQGIVFAEREGFRALEVDVYRRDGAPRTPHPLLVYVHGGGWRQSHRGRPPRETREWTPGFFERLTAAGFVVAAPSYRFSGEAIFPAQLDDVVDALRWLHDGQLGADVDTGRTVVWGLSAGGLLAALLALHPDGPPVAGVVCSYSITDLLALDRDRADTFEAHLVGGPIGDHLDLARAASPVTHVHAGAPPFLLQHGDADTWVPCDQSRRLADRLRAVGVPVELQIVPGADHFFAGAADIEAIYDRAIDFLLRSAGA
jgi:dipeptidyl aminopeptidase/acylaminoacyl peptidase